jgi:hypothetical protein
MTTTTPGLQWAHLDVLVWGTGDWIDSAGGEGTLGAVSMKGESVHLYAPLLDRYALLGWELAAATTTGGAYRFFFERPKT